MATSYNYNPPNFSKPETAKPSQSKTNDSESDKSINTNTNNSTTMASYTPSNFDQNGNPIPWYKKPKTYIFAGIGLVVIIGTALFIRHRKK